MHIIGEEPPQNESGHLHIRERQLYLFPLLRELPWRYNGRDRGFLLLTLWNINKFFQGKDKPGVQLYYPEMPLQYSLIPPLEI